MLELFNDSDSHVRILSTVDTDGRRNCVYLSECDVERLKELLFSDGG